MRTLSIFGQGSEEGGQNRCGGQRFSGGFSNAYRSCPAGAPVGLVAVSLKDGIELNWRRNQEPDLLGIMSTEEIRRDGISKTHPSPFSKRPTWIRMCSWRGV